MKLAIRIAFVLYDCLLITAFALLGHAIIATVNDRFALYLAETTEIIVMVLFVVSMLVMNHGDKQKKKG